MAKEELRNATVAIFGSGISGLGVAELLDAYGGKYEFFHEPEKPFTAADASRFDLVVSSPGFKPDHQWMGIARDSGLPLYGEIDFGANLTDHPIVAITGTNGKTTLCTFLAHLWRQAGRSSVCAGNVGTSLCSSIARGIPEAATIFLEVSSFQSQSLRLMRPQSVIWTNFSPDHLDYHGGMEEYFQAKARILEGLPKAGEFICGPSVLEFAQSQNLSLARPSRVISSSSVLGESDQLPSFWTTCPQRENLALASEFARRNSIAESIFTRAVESYDPQPARLSKVGEINGVCFWNDSKATNLSAVTAAFRSFSSKVIWIGGGREKGECLKSFCQAVKGFVDHAFLIGEVSHKLYALLRSSEIVATVCGSLEEAVCGAFASAKGKSQIVFSPGFASFDMFADYLERGNLFNRIVFDLKKSPSPSTQECLL